METNNIENQDTENKQADSSNKSLGERIEELVIAMEKLERLANKKFSVKSAFLRGMAQGLGIIIGSTIVAGILYAAVTKFISPSVIQKLMLENVVEQSLQEK